MTGPRDAGSNDWWIARWSGAALLVSSALVLHIGTGWQWKPVAFALAGTWIVGSLIVYELVARRSASAAYRAGVAIAAATSFLIVWINVAVGMVGEDDPANLSFFMLIVMAAVGAFAAAFRAEGMARAMLGVAGAQALVAVAIATAPSTEQPLGVLMLNSLFVALWLISAALFHRSARLEATDPRSSASSGFATDA